MHTPLTTARRLVCSGLLGGLMALSAGTALAELPPDLKTKVEGYQKRLTEWAANPTVVKATRDANAAGGGTTNAKWDDLADGDPAIKATLTGPASELLKKWEEDKQVNKLTLRDARGQTVASSTRVFLYNAANRPHVAAALKGTANYTQEVKPDPATQVRSVQLAVPVLDGGKTIGVLNAAINAD